CPGVRYRRSPDLWCGAGAKRRTDTHFQEPGWAGAGERSAEGLGEPALPRLSPEYCCIGPPDRNPQRYNAVSRITGGLAMPINMAQKRAKKAQKRKLVV